MSNLHNGKMCKAGQTCEIEIWSDSEKHDGGMAESVVISGLFEHFYATHDFILNYVQF